RNQRRRLSHTVLLQRLAQRTIQVLGVIVLRRAKQHRDLAACRVRRVMAGEVGQRPTPHLLEMLGQFARHGGRTGAKGVRHVGQGLGQTMRRLMPDQGGGQAGSLGGAQGTKRGATSSLPRRRKTQKQKGQGRQPGQDQRGHGGVRARDGGDRQTLRNRRAHEAIPRIGDQRRARVGYQRDPPAGTHPRQDRGNARVFVVLVQRFGPDSAAKRRQQAGGVTRVLAQDQVAVL